MTNKFLSFTAKDLDRIIENNDNSYGDRGWSELKYREYERFLHDDQGGYVKDADNELVRDPLSLKGIFLEEIEGWISTIDEYGGEGQGDDYWVIVKIAPDDAEIGAPRYFKKSGYYASYDGGYLDGDCLEVRPREKTITVYE